MGKNQNSVMVLQIHLKFWWMIPMGVKYNHTKFEQETQRWQPGTTGMPPSLLQEMSSRMVGAKVISAGR